MWNILKADIQELVSVVKEDASSLGIPVAENSTTDSPSHMPPTKTAAQKEVEWRMGIPETFTVPLLPQELLPDQPKDPPNEVQAEDSTDAVTEPNDSEEYDAEDDEIKKIQDYVSSFKIDEQTDAIANALEQYPDSLRIQFENLVPEHVTYLEFWERFFYRCDTNRIEEEWSAEEERARAARAQLVTNVTSFFGGAAKAVAAGVANALTEDGAGSHYAARTTGAGIGGIFGAGSGHRPPFVMNTAVDEDDDDEEEELGWDDDDEDEEEIAMKTSSMRGSKSLNESEEQIEFVDAALDLLKKQLKQALEERDSLHNTVELQTKEIALLKEMASYAASAAEATKAEDFPSKGDFGVSDEVVKNLQAQIQEMTTLLLDKEQQISSMQDQFDTTSKGLQEGIDSLTKENDLRQIEWSKVEDSLLVEQKALEDKIAKLENERSSLEVELGTTRASLEASKTEVSGLKEELEDLKRSKDEQPSATTIVDGAMSSSADTSSTGVKVPPVVSKINAISDNNEEEEEGWGDDWD